MESFIPALSPLLVYSPCKDCGGGLVGWQSGNETGGGSVSGSVGKLSIGYNLTGTGVAFAFTQPIPKDWTSNLLVNSTKPPTSADLTSTSISNLPLGTHRFTLDLFPPTSDPFASTSSNATVAFTGATGYLGTMLTAATKNTTVDDTAWRTFDVILSPGWNMLEGASGGQSNWINTTQIDAERVRAGDNWNSSESWTEERGANTTIRFEGETVWVYGATGPDAGRYEVVIDDLNVGVYNGSAVNKSYGQILYHTSSLSKGDHNVTLRNIDAGKRLTFDRLMAMSGAAAAAPRPSVSASQSSSYPTSTAGSADNNAVNRLGGGALAGIVIGAVLGAIAVIGLIILFFVKRRNGKSRQSIDDEYSTEKYDDRNRTFMQWPRSTTPPFSRMDDSAKPIGFLAKLWHHRPGSRSPDESFVPGMPATPRATYITNPVQPTSDDYYTSFLKFDKSPRKTKEQSGYGRPNISSPTPLDRPDIGDHTGTRPQTPPTPITDGLSPAMAAALSGRTISPLAQLRDGGELINRSSDAEEGRSYLPKMTGFASMFPRSQLRQQESGQEDSSWKRPSVDTIGQIFGNYGSGTPKSGQEFDMVTAEQRREKWDQRVRNVGQPHAI